MLDEARTAYRSGDYTLAIHRYNAARKCNPAYESVANNKILEVFEELKGLKDKAERASREARQRAEEAEAAKSTAHAARERAEQSDRIGRNAVLAMKAARTDPVVGLRMAKFLMDHYPAASVGWTVFNDIFTRTDQFYKEKFSPFYRGQHATTVSFSPDGKYLLMGTSTGEGIRLCLSGKRDTAIKVYGRFYDQVQAARFLDGGRRVMMFSSNTVKVWDTQSAKEICSFTDLTAAAASPDGLHLVLADQGGIISVRTARDTALLARFGTDKAFISKIAIANGAKSIVTVTDSTNMTVWTEAGMKKADWKGHSDEIWSISFSPKGDQILTGSDDNTAKLWGSDGKERATFAGHTNDVYWASFSADSNYVFTASEDNTLKQWNIKGFQVAEFKGHTKPVKGVTCEPTGSRIASIDEGGVCLLWQVNSLSPSFNMSASKTFKHSRKMPATMGTGDFLYALGRDGRTILACKSDSVRLINLYGTSRDRGKAFSIGRSPKSVALSPDMNIVVAGYQDGTLLRWKTEGGVLLDSLKGHKSYVASIQFAPDGKSFVTASWDKTACVWDAQSGRLKAKLEGHTDRVECAAINNQGSVLTGSRDGTAKLWSAHGKEMKTIAGHSRKVSAVTFAPDGQSFVTGSWDKTARLWSIEGNNKAIFEGHLEEITSVAFAPNGKSIITGSIDNSVRQWTPGGEEIIKLEGHKTDVTALCYIGDSLILSGDRQGEVFSWYTIEAFTEHQVANTPLLDLVKERLELEDREIAESKESELLIYSARLKEEKEDWAAAQPLYERAYGLSPSSEAMLGIYRLSEKMKQPFDFSRFMVANDAGTLKRFAQALFNEKKHLPEATQLLEKAERIAHDPEHLTLLQDIATYTNASFDFNRFLSADNPYTLDRYGRYFQDRNLWEKAAQLYEKAETKQHNTVRIINWDRAAASAKSSRPDFSNFMVSDSTEELTEYAKYFYGRSMWDEAWQLYEKTLSKKYLGYNLLQMQRITKRTKRTVDFSLFLKSENPSELRDFASYFYREAEETESRRRSATPPVLDSLLNVERSLWDKSSQLYERLYALRPSPSTLRSLYETSEKAGKNVDFNRFFASSLPDELNDYARLFYEKENWDKAKRLYQKSDSIQRSATSFSGLYLVAMGEGKKDEASKIFQEMLRSEKPDDLLQYARVLRPTLKMTERKIPLEEYYAQTKQLEDKAFSLLNPVDASAIKKGLADSYNSLGWDQLFIPDSIGTGPKGCELSILRGIELDPSNLYLFTNLPTAYLLQGQWGKAQKIYLERKDQPYMSERGMPYYRDVFIKDIEEFEEQGITHPDFNCVRQLMGKPLPDKPCKRL